MDDFEELRLFSELKLELPIELTEEELLLKSKFEKLRKAKQRLLDYRATGSCNSTRKKIVISKPVKMMKRSASCDKKTTDLKNWSKQTQDVAVKRTYPIHSFEEDSEPRSVKISGKNLTDDCLHKHFNEFGDILKIRTNEEKNISVLTFKRPPNREKLADFMKRSVIDGSKLEVTILRKNTCWSDISSSQQTKMKNKGKSVHLKFKGHLTTGEFDEFFQSVGKITRIYLNESKHFGFAMFENEDQAQRAIREMDGEMCNGIKVYVSTQHFSKGGSPNKVPQWVPQHEKRELIRY